MLESSGAERVAIAKTFEIKEFINQHNISDRESDVFLLLANGITTTNEISEQLGLSPNTISNHLNSLLGKTQAKNKSELLAKFLNMHAKKLQEIQLVSRRPRLMVISESVDVCQEIQHNLSPRGFQVFTAESVSSVSRSICGMRLDFLLVDEGINEGKGIEYVRSLKAAQQCPAFGVIGRDETNADTFARDTVEWVKYPVDFNHLAFMVLEASIEKPMLKNRFLRVNAENLKAEVNQVHQFEVANIGYGGACLVVSRGQLLKDKMFRKSKRMIFKISLSNGHDLSGEAEVCWVRKKDQIGMRSGIGVKFIDLSLDQQRLLRQYVRDQKYVSLNHL